MNRVLEITVMDPATLASDMLWIDRRGWRLSRCAREIDGLLGLEFQELTEKLSFEVVSRTAKRSLYGVTFMLARFLVEHAGWQVCSQFGTVSFVDPHEADTLEMEPTSGEDADILPLPFSLT